MFFCTVSDIGGYLQINGAVKDMNEDFLKVKLEQRNAANSLRDLRVSEGLIDFCSNDYLGIATNNLVADRIANHTVSSRRYGSTGSRLLSGNYRLIEEAEKTIATFHQAEAGLIFGSGYEANIGLLSAVPQRGDTVIYDYLCHASIRDGIRLSFAESTNFQHNDLNDLEQKLKKARGNIFVVSESVFSMDGDIAPVGEIIALCNRYQANFVIDEAHSTGVVGERGEGLVSSLGLAGSCFARIHTFGKAVGCAGAIVVGSNTLRSYLINFSRSFIYTTAMPFASTETILAAYDIFPGMQQERATLKRLIEVFSSLKLPFDKLKSDTCIQGIVVPGADNVKAVARRIQDAGFDVRPILYPTVPKGTERLRIVLHSFNTIDQLERLATVLASIA
jgi:8-amino-7-oxononanoate synthase